MSKKAEVAKPLFPLQHEFLESLKAYQHKADMLAGAVDTILSIADDQKDLISPNAADMLKAHLAAFRAAQHGST